MMIKRVFRELGILIYTVYLFFVIIGVFTYTNMSEMLLSTQATHFNPSFLLEVSYSSVHYLFLLIGSATYFIFIPLFLALVGLIFKNYNYCKLSIWIIVNIFLLSCIYGIYMTADDAIHGGLIGSIFAEVFVPLFGKLFSSLGVALLSGLTFIQFFQLFYQFLDKLLKKTLSSVFNQKEYRKNFEDPLLPTESQNINKEDPLYSYEFLLNKENIRNEQVLQIIESEYSFENEASLKEDDIFDKMNAKIEQLLSHEGLFITNAQFLNAHEDLSEETKNNIEITQANVKAAIKEAVEQKGNLSDREVYELIQKLYQEQSRLVEKFQYMSFDKPSFSLLKKEPSLAYQDTLNDPSLLAQESKEPLALSENGSHHSQKNPHFTQEPNLENFKAQAQEPISFKESYNDNEVENEASYYDSKEPLIVVNPQATDLHYDYSAIDYYNATQELKEEEELVKEIYYSLSSKEGRSKSFEEQNLEQDENPYQGSSVSQEQQEMNEHSDERRDFNKDEELQETHNNYNDDTDFDTEHENEKDLLEYQEYQEYHDEWDQKDSQDDDALLNQQESSYFYEPFMNKKDFRSSHSPIMEHSKAEPIKDSPPLFHLPSLELFEFDDSQEEDNVSDEEIEENARIILGTLKEFNIQAQLEDAIIGPVVTRYEIKPPKGLKVSKIIDLSDNIALGLASKERVRIEAPVYGKSVVGIEVANKKRQLIAFKDLLKSFPKDEIIKNYHLPFILGKSIDGSPVIKDIAKMPHLLIAGSTGAGKSVSINTLINSILFYKTPHEVRLLLVDPKRVELVLYDGLPHLISPVIKETTEAIRVLKWLVTHMEERYMLLEKERVRNILEYNIQKKKENAEIMPYLVVVMDEFADLILIGKREVEESVIRLAAMARAVGIHLVLATQRPSADVITGLIKANFASRIAFRVSSKMESRIILDENGAEALLGKGDMLFMSSDIQVSSQRIQAPFISDKEVQDVTDFFKKQYEPQYWDDILQEESFEESSYDEDNDDDDDMLFKAAVEVVIQANKATASYLQRRLKIGYNRAARLIEMMEERGIVSQSNGNKPRIVLVDSY
jgi:DNA segregation ATPase FtsK/SpoIIIE-like protein